MQRHLTKGPPAPVSFSLGIGLILQLGTVQSHFDRSQEIGYPSPSIATTHRKVQERMIIFQCLWNSDNTFINSGNPRKKKTLKSTAPSTFKRECHGMSSWRIRIGGSRVHVLMKGCPWHARNWFEPNHANWTSVLPNSWISPQALCTLQGFEFQEAKPKQSWIASFVAFRIRHWLWIWLDLLHMKPILPQNVGAKRSLPLQHLVSAEPLGDGSDKKFIAKMGGKFALEAAPIQGFEVQEFNVIMQVAI